jgi:hypothetical protein
MEGHTEVVSLLLDRGADINALEMVTYTYMYYLSSLVGLSTVVHYNIFLI